MELDATIRDLIEIGPIAQDRGVPVLLGQGRGGQFSINLSPMRDELGHVSSIVVVMTDITDAAMLLTVMAGSDPADPQAAANGQYILMSRAAYAASGGHEAICGEVLEDVLLARRVKQALLLWLLSVRDMMTSAGPVLLLALGLLAGTALSLLQPGHLASSPGADTSHAPALAALAVAAIGSGMSTIASFTVPPILQPPEEAPVTWCFSSVVRLIRR